MKFRKRNDDYQLSVIVIFHNMNREARRTLYSLTHTYQQNIEGIRYEVLAIDNGSTEPLDKTWIESLGQNFRYSYFKTGIPSPCAALNHGAEIAKGKYINICIDGARILSPGILKSTMLAVNIHDSPFIYTLSMHIGNKPQQYLTEEGYSQKDEDKLMASIQWEENGYLLFDISSVAISSGNGYFSSLRESNCITIPRSTFEQIGGFDERFTSAGGGLANLDFFNRVNQRQDLLPVLLLGEATFHQFHGGTTTNVPLSQNPWNEIAAEYQSIKGRPYQPHRKDPVYFGSVHSKCKHLLKPAA